MLKCSVTNCQLLNDRRKYGFKICKCLMPGLAMLHHNY